MKISVTHIDVLLFAMNWQSVKICLFLIGELEEHSKSLRIILELRKIAPVTTPSFYTPASLHWWYSETNVTGYLTWTDIPWCWPPGVYEDMTGMTDFELHRLCLSYPALRSHCLPQTVFGESGKLKFLAGKLSELKEKVLWFIVTVYTS